MADVEKCCKLTDVFLKSSAASASISAISEPAHQGERQDSEEYEEEEEQNEQEEDEEIDMDNESMELTNTEQQACCGSECGLPEATEMETNAAGGSVATASLATSEYYIIMELLALMIY